MTYPRHSIAILALLAMTSVSVMAADAPAEAPLDAQLQKLTLPSSELPPSASYEKLYSVQSRESGLSLRHEITASIGKSLVGQDFVNSFEVSGSYRFHFTDRWSLGFSGTYVNNSLTKAAQELISVESIYPDIVYPRYLADATVGYNLFYGKFRLSMDSVLYFDQYLELGGGLVGLTTGQQKAVVAGAGLAFWIGKNGTVRLGFKDYIYDEVRRLSSSVENNLEFHLDVGLLLGGKS
ncbi:MAG TPA: outer membrane beta-barrel domain-containing protein [Bdellovibrionota bacterium]|nr:outer membrane beta-barrel domain-containing protein [Bdellovibrionota bacterium]